MEHSSVGNLVNIFRDSSISFSSCSSSAPINVSCSSLTALRRTTYALQSVFHSVSYALTTAITFEVHGPTVYSTTVLSPGVL